MVAALHAGACRDRLALSARQNALAASLVEHLLALVPGALHSAQHQRYSNNPPVHPVKTPIRGAHIAPH
eukprot:8030892-Lingulodinium_polyedra.AAC.1